MSKRILFLAGSLVLFFSLMFSVSIPILKHAQAETNDLFFGPIVDFPISRQNSGIIQNNTLGIYGPQICTAFGDPFSSWYSVWEPNSYTYRYLIRIPPDYDDDVVRVELFDPDSVNRSNNDVTIAHSSFAINNGLPPVKNDICGSINSGTSAQQRNPCVIETDETDLLNSGQAVFDQINPFWFVRVDENRGVGVGNGNGTCNPPDQDPPPPYNPNYNTETLFQLNYYRETTDGRLIKEEIASYIGNTGDSRDLFGFHETDLRWVSPGADKQGYDFPIADTPLVSEVPTTEGDTSFEVNLNEINNINVDPATGARFLYLDVTTLSGASENAFHVWAGPNDYVETFPTDVNARNLAILNNPGSHDSRGIQVEAISRMTINNIYPNPIDWPIAYLPSSTAGGNVYVSIFDMDDGAQPPITFFFDSIPESAWSLTFNEPGVDDPDGVAAGVRCDLDGTSENNCNDQWTTPPYTITIPGNQANCDRFDLNDADCIPFTGGTLMARVNGGMYDTSSWEVKTNLPKTVDTTQSCAAFPIAVPPSMRSLAEPFSYPNSEDFDYPLAPPSFGQFVNHIRAVTLADATEGTVFKVSRGISNASYDFGWLKWNLGITGINGSGTSGDNAVLANSLTWPGYSMDYADHDDPGSVVADGISHVVRGYVEPGDATDQVAHVDDWVAASGSQLPAIAPAVNELIDEAPVLRLIVWDAADGSFGANGRYTIQQFALFKIIGYGNSNAEDEWLLLEFIGLDNSCGQLQKSGVDLVIDELQIIDIDTLQLEQPLTAQVTISNVGTVDIAHSWFTVDFYLNPSQTDPLPSGDMFGAASFTNLPVGAQKTISYTFSSGTNQQFNNALYAKVDSSDFIIETDKTNNVAAILNFKVSLNERFVYLPVVHR